MAEAIINRKGSPIRAIFTGIYTNSSIGLLEIPELIGAKNAVITLVKQNYSQAELIPVSSIVIENGKVAHVTCANSKNTINQVSTSVVRFYPNFGFLSVENDTYCFPIDYNPISDTFRNPTEYFCVIY